ncbi:hypothetical protein JCM19046_2226 [Bacillus sp. JCM 19046]|nr:hypothetical protein JCM19045_3596 [Bacillus sp. JCM 19045]GAF17701.1 hypothetical protein JCM19046_2226 [Bacillus sp. JCM 19046]
MLTLFYHLFDQHTTFSKNSPLIRKEHPFVSSKGVFLMVKPFLHLYVAPLLLLQAFH